MSGEQGCSGPGPSHTSHDSAVKPRSNVPVFGYSFGAGRQKRPGRSVQHTTSVTSPMMPVSARMRYAFPRGWCWLPICATTPVRACSAISMRHSS